LRIDVVAQRALQMTPSLRLVSQVMVRDADHSLAAQPIVRVGMLPRDGVKPLGHGKGGAALIAVVAINPKPPQRPQLVLGVAERFGEAECCSAGSLDLRRRAVGKQQRCAQSSLELHLAARVPVRCRPESGERLHDPAAALLKQRQTHPKGYRSSRQCHPDRRVAARRKGPVECRKQIVDFRGVIRQPFFRRPRRRFTLGALEKVAIVLGVAVRDRFPLAAFGEPFKRIGAGCIKQTVVGIIVCNMRRNQRFFSQIRNTFDRISMTMATAAAVVKAPRKTARRLRTTCSASGSSS